MSLPAEGIKMPVFQSNQALYQKAIEGVFNRMNHMADACGNQFPLYSIGFSDQWVLSKGGSWIGGFWGSLWWLRARLRNSLADYQKAHAIGQQLQSKLTVDSSHRSLIFWYGAALGAKWFQDRNAMALTQRATKALVKAYVPEWNAIPLGKGLGGGAKGAQQISIDSWASLIQLLSQEKGSQAEQMAREHSNTLLQCCMTEEGAFYPLAEHEHGQFRPVGQAGCWSRGQAWGLLGVSRAAQMWGEPYLSQALKALDYWCTHHNGLLENPPFEGQDPSATIIACWAMLILAQLLPGDVRCHIEATKNIESLLKSPYFVLSNPPQGDREYALFWGARYQTNATQQDWVESAWGSFFLLAVLSILTGALEACEG